MRRVVFSVRLFRSEAERAHSERCLRILLTALAACNVSYLLGARGRTPPLYEAGVRYRAEPYPRENWLTIPELYEQGFGDCEDLACARVAELNVQGIEARPTFRFRRLNERGEPDIGGRFSLYHILVEHPDGSVEDPSALLGMGSNPWAVHS